MKPPQPVPIERVLAQRDWVRRLARGLVTNAADQDDVEQETWLRTLRQPPHEGGSIRSWLARVVRSVRIDSLRAERQRRAREARVARPEAERVEDVVAQADTFRAVVDAAYALEEPQRTVVLLRYFEELSPREIAERLGIDEEAVRSRLRRALARMRERLDAAAGGDRSAWIGAVAVVAGLPRRGRRIGGASAAAVVAGGVLMSITKVAAAVAVLVAIGWWAWDTTVATPPTQKSPEAVATEDAEPTAVDHRAPVRHERTRARAADETAAPGEEDRSRDAPTADPLLTALGKPERQGPELIDLTRRVVDERGAAVAGAAVLVTQARRMGNTLVLGSALSVSAQTDANGSFTARVPRDAANLVARVSVDGFVDAEAALVDGETEMRVRLKPAWTLRGVVVARDTSRPVAGMLVVALRAGTDDGVGSAATDAEGRFAIARVPVESLDLRVGERIEAPDGLVRTTVTTTFGSGSSKPDHFALARVAGIAPYSGELRVELAPALSIEGHVIDSQGAPVRARLFLSVIGQTAQGGPDYTVRRLVYIEDEQGAFRVDGLGEGLYDLAFEPAPASAPAPTAGRTIGAVRVGSVAAGTRDLRVVLPEGARIRVRVLGPDGTPVKGGYIYVSETGRTPGDHGTVMAEPGPDGVLVTPTLDGSKTFDLLITLFPGCLQARREGVRPGNEELVVQLERAGRISGQVVDEDGRPVGAKVPVRATAQDVTVQGVGTGWVCSTDATGKFSLDSLSDHVFVLAAGGGDSGYMAVAETRDVRLGRDDVVLRVRRGVEITGRLRDRDGSPVRTHYLSAQSLEPGSGNVWATGATTKIEGDDGRFTLRGVPPGRVRLSCYVGDRFVELGEFDAPAKDLELTLPGR